MDWRVKGIVQKILSLTPGGLWINDRLQRSLGGLRHFEKNIETKVQDWLGIMHLLEQTHYDPEGKEILEVGTGWYPTLPICFSLANVRRCVTYDRSRHLDPDLTHRMVHALRRHLPSVAQASRRGLSEVESEWRALDSARSLSLLLERARIDYVAPADASRMDLPGHSLDLVYSNSVLEHVPGTLILAIMRETHRTLRPGGVALHSVACNDHYAHFDRTISFVNYLRFNEADWKLWNNSLNYQNRLRAPDFLRLAEAGGLEIATVQTAIRPGSLEALSRMRVAPEFSAYEPSDLAITSVNFVARASSSG